MWRHSSTLNIHKISTISKLSNGWFWSPYSLSLPIRPLLLNVYFHQNRRPEDSICPKRSPCNEFSQFIYLNENLNLKLVIKPTLMTSSLIVQDISSQDRSSESPIGSLYGINYTCSAGVRSFTAVISFMQPSIYDVSFSMVSSILPSKWGKWSILNTFCLRIQIPYLRKIALVFELMTQCLKSIIYLITTTVYTVFLQWFGVSGVWGFLERYVYGQKTARKTAPHSVRNEI